VSARRIRQLFSWKAVNKIIRLLNACCGRDRSDSSKNEWPM
jgi:hypothetical protein